MAMQPTMLRPPIERPVWQTVLGCVLILPAFVLLLISYVEPTIWTVRSSFQHFTGQRFLTGGSGGPGVGFDNYGRAFDTGLGKAVGYSLGLAVVPLLIVLLLAPALAWGAARAGRTARWVTRGLLTIPLAAFAPLAIALGLVVSDKHGPRTAYWLGTFGAVAAVSTLIYLAAFRRRDPDRSPWPAVIVAALLSTLGVFAVALQEFTSTYISGYAGKDRPLTPAVLMVDSALRNFDFGTGTAVSTVLLLPLLLFGAAATVLVIVTGLRLEFDTAGTPEPPATRNPAPWIVGGVLLLVTLAVTWTGIGPWLSRITDEARDSAGPTWANTWLPPLVSTLVGVGAAALAAFGISALRPLGRHSEWLLLPFGLFLFVGVAPLALRSLASGATAGRLNSFVGLIPPGRVAIPALFALALLFRGQALRRATLHQENRPAPWSGVILPALPMLALAFLATWAVQAQNLLWPFITSTGGYLTAPYVALRALQQFDVAELPFARLLPLPMLLALLLLGVAAQLLYLDRVGLRTGLPERDHPPRT